MERTFTTTTHGPVAFELPAGTARVTVDRTAKTATIRLHTPDSDGPSVDAIRDSRSNSQNGLTVTVPDNGSGNGGVTVISGGSYSNVSVSGSGTVTVNGNVISCGGRVSRGITADIAVPPGTDLVFRGKSSDLTVTGPLAALDASTVSGDIRAGVLGDAVVRTVSGDVEIDAVSRRLDASTTSGDIEVGSYSGEQAMLNAVSGDVNLAATQSAAGPLSARTVSGDIRLRGAQHLRPQVSSVSGRVRA